MDLIIESLFQILNYIRKGILFASDIFIVAAILYQSFRLINKTRAVQMLRGLLFFFIITVIAGFIDLSVTEWLLKRVWTIALIVVVVVFQPEIRSMLAEIGKRRLYNIKFNLDVKNAIFQAINHFSALKIGALIVIQRNTGLKEYIDNGVVLNANISAELLKTIFMPKTALHDGAVILNRNQIVSAASFLPLSKEKLDPSIGTRHRAALGLSEISDAFIIVVSEETGKIAIARDGDLRWQVPEEDLVRFLDKVYLGSSINLKRRILNMLKPVNWLKHIDEKLIAAVIAGLVWYYIKFTVLV